MYFLPTILPCSGRYSGQRVHIVHIVLQLYGVPHGILRVFNTILYENEFRNPQILMDTLEIT
jgi:hypothetical protein